ncbi:MAG TPA: ISAs1 family transposase [Thermomicrobiales bacterium]|nr:ISAs1 family transposase [Thermomicrobiales bacterium]
MQSTVFPAPRSVSLTSLAAAFATVPDPRRAASVRYPLPAILAMTVAAILANHLSVLAISEWAARQTEPVLTALGFPTVETPCQSTLQRLFAKLDGSALSMVLAIAMVPTATPPEATDAAERVMSFQGVAIDGKAHRGRLRFAGGGCPIHALSAYCHTTGVVLAQEPILAPTDTDRGEAELTVAPILIDRLAWRGRVLTGDALFCQRELCAQVLRAGGDYLLAVKANQPTLLTDLRLLFDPPDDGRRRIVDDRREAETLDYGHGRTLERRVVTASTALVGYLDWPGHAQVLRIERTWREHDSAHRAVSYAITSLAPQRAGPAQLLALKRGHWAIENQLHRGKDVNLGEDASLIHVASGPHVMALLRDAAINLLHLAGVRQVAARLRRHAQHPDEAVSLVLGSLTTHA